MWPVSPVSAALLRHGRIDYSPSPEYPVTPWRDCRELHFPRSPGLG